MGGNGVDVLAEACSYEPVMYKLVKELDKRGAKDNESLVDI
jgi:hypothetical protein